MSAVFSRAEVFAGLILKSAKGEDSERGYCEKRAVGEASSLIGFFCYQ